MRTKSEVRREAIMAIALDTFREVGFFSASMSQIAARAGGSKATLYNYFSSKEELLFEAMQASGTKHANDAIALLNTQGDVRSQLHSFVASFLQLISSPDTIQVLRVAISVSATSDVGQKFYRLGTETVWKKVAQLLSKEVEKKTFRDDDPTSMAMHLRCLCEAELVKNLLGAGSNYTSQEASSRAELIVDLFFRTYGAHS